MASILPPQLLANISAFLELSDQASLADVSTTHARVPPPQPPFNHIAALLATATAAAHDPIFTGFFQDPDSLQPLWAFAEEEWFDTTT